MENLTPRQKAALRGQLSRRNFEREGMGLFQLGLVSLDPLPDGPEAFSLTEQGRKVAVDLRQIELMWRPKVVQPRHPRLVALLRANKARLKVMARRAARRVLIKHGIDPDRVFKAADHQGSP